MTAATSLQAIRRDIKFTPHLQGQDVWYAVEDPSTGRFIRLGRQEYIAAIHLDGRRNAEEIMASAKLIEPTFQLTDREIVTLAGWLSGVGFLQASQNLSTSQTSTPHSSRIVWDPLNARFPLLPGQWVEAIARVLQPLTSTIATFFVFVLSICAAVALFAKWEDYWTVSQKLFVAEGRIWWIVAWLLLKVVHECGHAVTAVRAGSQIRSAGISFIFFAPVPYIDVSDLWSISNRWQRILCSAGGMLFEIAVSAVAVFVALTAESESLRYFAAAVATTGTITTLLFNGNPFVRFDGYYILADLVQKPNLWVDGQRAASGCIQKVITPWKRSTERYSLAIVAYGLICWASRIVTLVGLAMWALLVWQEIGFFMIAWASYAWFVAPWWKSTKAECARNQISTRKMLLSSRVWAPPLTIACLLLMAYILPSPIQPNVPGIVDFEEPNVVRSECEGFLAKVYVDELQEVEAGDLIAEFRNDALQYALAAKRLEIAESNETISVLRARREISNLQAEQAKMVSLQDQLAQIEKNARNLEVRATVGGTIVHCDLTRKLGKFFKAGEPLAAIARPDALEVKLLAGQSEQHTLSRFSGQQITLSGFGVTPFCGEIKQVDLRGSTTLDEPALAATYGGPITVKLNGASDKNQGLQLPTPRFEVRIKLNEVESSALVPGQLAWARIPHSRTSILGVLSNWLNKKWESAKIENNAS